MAIVGETARFSFTGMEEATERRRKSIPPQWVSYAKKLIIRENGNSRIPIGKAGEAVRLIQEGFKQSNKEPHTEAHILSALADCGYFGSVDREDLLLSVVPPANPRKLREAREELGMSIGELSHHLKEAGISPHTARIVSLYEQGIYPLRGETLTNFSKFLGKKVENLTEMSEEERKELESLKKKVINPAQLKEKRKELGMVTKQVADAVGVHANTIESWESGRSSPKGLHIAVLCNLLSSTPDELSMPIEKEAVIGEQSSTTQKQWVEHLTALMDISAYIEVLEEKAANVDELKGELEKVNMIRKAQWEVIEQQQRQIERVLQALK